MVTLLNLFHSYINYNIINYIIYLYLNEFYYYNDNINNANLKIISDIDKVGNRIFKFKHNNIPNFNLNIKGNVDQLNIYSNDLKLEEPTLEEPTSLSINNIITKDLYYTEDWNTKVGKGAGYCLINTLRN